MKILVLGNGAREHSLCYAISRSPLATSLFCVPGNYGISLLAECKDLDLDDFNSIHSYCVEKSIDLIVVGPEVPLVAGIVDYFVSKNIKIWIVTNGLLLDTKKVYFLSQYPVILSLSLDGL